MMTRFDVPLQGKIRIPFHTFNSSGASVTMTNWVVDDIFIYKDGSTTERGAESAVTILGTDFDGLTGLHMFEIDTEEDDSPAGFWAVGSEYHIAVSAVTVDSQTIRFWAAWFRIVPVESSAGVPKVDVSHFGGSAGTFASGRPEVNLTHIAGSSVSTSTAQLGVNVVNFGGAAGTFASGRPEVNTSHIAGSAVSTSSAQIGVNVVNAGGTAWASGAITAASIATDAITNAKIAADAIGASEIADGAIDANTFAAGAITASAIATDAIGAAELAADAASEIGTAVWATAARTLTANTNLNDLSAAGVRSAVGLASANLDTQLDALPTNAELSTALGTADDAVLAAIAALNNVTAAQVATAVLTTQMTEAYAADGVAPTLAQALFLVMQHLSERSISSTTLTVKKLDGTTTAATFTLDSATTPTSITRAT